MNAATATPTRTIHVICRADGTPLMNRSTRWPKNAEQRDRTVPVCFGGTREAAEAWGKMTIGFGQVITITWAL